MTVTDADLEAVLTYCRALLDAADRIDGMAARRLRSEADAWAQVWADTVNRVNGQRHNNLDTRLQECCRGRPPVTNRIDDGESAGTMGGIEPVEAPVALTRYAATGTLMVG